MRNSSQLLNGFFICCLSLPPLHAASRFGPKKKKKKKRRGGVREKTEIDDGQSSCCQRGGGGGEIPFSLNFWHSGVKRGEGRGRRAFFECLKLMKKSLLLRRVEAATLFHGKGGSLGKKSMCPRVGRRGKRGVGLQNRLINQSPPPSFFLKRVSSLYPPQLGSPHIFRVPLIAASTQKARQLGV